MASIALRGAGPAPPDTGDERALPDEELLTRFLEGPSAAAEASFRALVLRHGPMVLSVCRHVLGQQQDAEDAFQATFLTLARKAGSIRDRRVLARWLYEVASRIAMRARSGIHRRQAYERQGAEMAVVPEHDITLSELRPILHEEINRLPEKYRVPVILGYLEGRTNEEVAELLGWPVGTVKGRLFRARELLRERLTRRGLALSLALLALWLTPESAGAETVPASLVDETVASALRVSQSPAALPPAIAPLMQAAPNAMRGRFAAKTAVVLVLLLAIAGALSMAGVTSGLGPDLGALVPWPFGSLSGADSPPPCHAPAATPSPSTAPDHP